MVSKVLFVCRLSLNHCVCRISPLTGLLKLFGCAVGVRDPGSWVLELLDFLSPTKWLTVCVSVATRMARCPVTAWISTTMPVTLLFVPVTPRPYKCRELWFCQPWHHWATMFTHWEALCAPMVPVTPRHTLLIPEPPPPPKRTHTHSY